MGDKAQVISNPHGAGRPTASIDWPQVEAMCMAGMEGIAIAQRFGIHYDTLYNAGIREKRWGPGQEFPNFSAYRQHFYEVGNSAILERQFMLAMGQRDPNTKRWIVYPSENMLKWLGKQRLNQYDALTVKDNEKPLEIPAPKVTIIEQS